MGSTYQVKEANIHRQLELSQSAMRKVVGDIIGQIIVGLIDGFMVVSGVLFAFILLATSLVLWMLDYTTIALVIMSILLLGTIDSRFKTTKDKLRTPDQRQKVNYIIDILLAVEASFVLIIFTGFTLSTCTLLLSATILANVIHTDTWR